MESDEVVQPSIQTFSQPIVTEDGEAKVYLTVVEYANGLQASLYDRTPKLGSMTLGYPIMDKIERQTLFQGKHDQLAGALAMLLTKMRNKIVYASVNVGETTILNLEIIKNLVNSYEDSFQGS